MADVYNIFFHPEVKNVSADLEFIFELVEQDLLNLFNQEPDFMIGDLMLLDKITPSDHPFCESDHDDTTNLSNSLEPAKLIPPVNNFEFSTQSIQTFQPSRGDNQSIVAETMNNNVSRSTKYSDKPDHEFRPSVKRTSCFRTDLNRATSCSNGLYGESPVPAHSVLPINYLVSNEVWLPPEINTQSSIYSFQSSELVPAVYLKTVHPTLLPHNFFVFANKLVQKTGRIYFYIEAKENTILYDPTFFTIFIKSPAGYSCPVRLERDSLNPACFICCFNAATIGSYLIHVRLGNHGDFQIQDSPLKIIVCRNYNQCLERTIVRIGFQRMHNSSQSIPVSDIHFHVPKAYWGIAANPDNEEIYITDRYTNQVIVFSPDGIILRRFGRKGSAPGQLMRPTGIAFDRTNYRLIVSDKDNHRICIFTLEGQFIFSFGSQGFLNGQFNYPWGVDVSPDGALIAVADSRNHRIQLFDSRGCYLRKYSVFEVSPFEYKSEFNYPRSIIFDNEGENLYVTDFNLNTIFKMNVELTTRKWLVPDGLLVRPQGLAVDNGGNILVCDSRNDCVRIINSNGEVKMSLYSTGGEVFNLPHDIALMKGGYVGVVDCSRRIRIF